MAESHMATKGSTPVFRVTIPGQSGAVLGWIGLPQAAGILRKVADSGVLLSHSVATLPHFQPRSARWSSQNPAQPALPHICESRRGFEPVSTDSNSFRGFRRLHIAVSVCVSGCCLTYAGAHSQYMAPLPTPMCAGLGRSNAIRSLSCTFRRRLPRLPICFRGWRLGYPAGSGLTDR